MTVARPQQGQATGNHINRNTAAVADRLVARIRANHRRGRMAPQRALVGALVRVLDGQDSVLLDDEVDAAREAGALLDGRRWTEMPS